MHDNFTTEPAELLAAWPNPWTSFPCVAGLTFESWRSSLASAINAEARVKPLYLLFVLSLVFALTACGKRDEFKYYSENHKEADRQAQICTGHPRPYEDIVNPDGCNAALRAVKEWYRARPHEAARVGRECKYDSRIGLYLGEVYGGCDAALSLVRELATESASPVEKSPPAQNR